MAKTFSPKRLDVKSFAEEGATITGQEPLRGHERLLAETHGRGAETPVTWSATGEVRNPLHVAPEVWLHLKAGTQLSLTCQRCLGPVEVPVAVERSFRFVADEQTAAAQDDESEEDVLALTASLDLTGLVEDELLMEMPLAPRHETCPPVHLVVEDEGFEGSSARHENPFAVLGQLKGPKTGG
ncbi:YceD family protein [Ramlibacter sp. PS4R-6]|uniref:YceD family protein n=1 Tax=Ramlibacter sp. PS4R-6 TaxID=3133438 RepID=UPI0030AA4927